MLLGHASIATTERYTAVDDAELWDLGHRHTGPVWIWLLFFTVVRNTVPGSAGAPREERT